MKVIERYGTNYSILIPQGNPQSSMSIVLAVSDKTMHHFSGAGYTIWEEAKSNGHTVVQAPS